jgi:hypothetical protein
VVIDGVTITEFPLVTARLPGVMSPVPLVKTPMRLAVPPAVIDAGVAVKLVMEGSENCLKPTELPQPVKQTRLRVIAQTSVVCTEVIRMSSPDWGCRKIRPQSSYSLTLRIDSNIGSRFIS